MDRCDECGFVYASVPRGEIASTLRTFGPRYAERLGSFDDATLRAHPIEGVWSVLEYGCHLRDVLRVQRERVLLAQREDTPTFSSMRRDERVSEERYNEQDPTVVAGEIAEGAEAVARTLEELDDAGWMRTGLYSWPGSAIRTIEWVGRHTIHECVHHLLDIDRLAAP